MSRKSTPEKAPTATRKSGPAPLDASPMLRGVNPFDPETSGLKHDLAQFVLTGEPFSIADAREHVATKRGVAGSAIRAECSRFITSLVKDSIVKEVERGILCLVRA